MKIKILVSMEATENFRIRTHNGIFHSDEIVAIAMLILKLERDGLKTVQILRTRENLFSNIEIDVGEGAFDHHQIGGNGIRDNDIPYASCGLIWKEYGKKIINGFKKANQQINTAEIFEVIDYRIAQKVDAEDNGRISECHSYSFITKFLPSWTDDVIDYDEAFERCLNVTVEVLRAEILAAINENSSKYKIRELMENKTSNVLELPNQIIPWVDNVIIENIIAEVPADFVIFRYPAGGWAAQCVPNSFIEKFTQRIPFPKEWAGKTNELSEITGVDGAILCHNERFFIRAKHKEEVIALCELAVKKFEEGLRM